MPSELLSLGPLACKSLFSPLTYKIAFYFSGESERKRQHFALYIIPKAVTVLYCPDTTFLDHTDVKYLHDHEQVPSQTRQFGTDYQVTFAHTLKQPPELPFGITLRAAYGFFYPSVDQDAFTKTEIGDLKSLILYGLLVTAYAYVAVVQNYGL